jgi:cellulose synthase (UDP-forming)
VSAHLLSDERATENGSQQALPRGPEIAPSCPIAQSARRFGDDYPPVQKLWLLRAASIAFAVSIFIYLPWLADHLNRSAPWLAWPFLLANVFSLSFALLACANQWWRSVPTPCPVPPGAEKLVGIIIPTCGEPVPLILRTVTSVLEQDWPRDQMVIVVSDDGHDPELALALGTWPVLYYSPPPRFSPGRDGAAKSGNLNAAAKMLFAEYPDIVYVETRDCDDELGSMSFLRHAAGQLDRDERLAYVQTIKETQVGAGDPFNNREQMFYRGQALARNSGNAVFPCGSGLLWRREALEDIDLFPNWNLVEDLQSGVEALRRGWRSCYLPIVGAVGQHSPEDLPNYYKQRGTWAIDSVRLVLYADKRGLKVAQRSQFLDMMLYYLHSFTSLVYVPSVILSLLGYPPFRTNAIGFLVHMLPLVVATELWLLAMNRPYNDRRKRQRRPIRELFRVRIIWSGMAPVYMRASISAVLGGPHRKPVYKVTRKENDARWHWAQAVPQAIIIASLVGATVYALRFHTVRHAAELLPPLYWGAHFAVLLAGFVARSWYGVNSLRKAILPTVERRAPEEEAKGAPASLGALAAQAQAGVHDALAPAPEPLEAN